ncbi:uncharacterized protein LOC131669618 [Phymastichus coffea]|uniref:uncharacterized protein LOC131669618 n=1 Tax=Phymastichus coffea TaxID=108790 RepID=UPI00273B6203|nr:uncharacterized protein LOC131669618 [Phymastichus coffea]
MLLTINEICIWAGENPSQRRFVEGERILAVGHLLNCGRTDVKVGVVKVKAFCLQTTAIKEKPHEIDIDISESGCILNCTCTCKASLSGKCKHVVAALLHCYRDSEHIQTFSCTDLTCSWKKPQKEILEKYGPTPLENHACFQNPDTYHLNNINLQLSPNDIKNIVIKNLPKSAFSKDMLGRHESIVAVEKSVSEAEKIAIKLIFLHQENQLLESLNKLAGNPLNNCCIKTLDMLNGNFEKIFGLTNGFGFDTSLDMIF